MANQLLTLLVAFMIGGFISTSTSAASSRIPSIDVQPMYLDKNRGPSDYTSYKPQPHERVRKEVLRVSSNGSFISRCVLVITRDGRTKNFEDITGQDGLTFGITHFATDGSIKDFMKIVSKYFPREFAAAFGANAANLLNDSWIKNNNAGGRGAKANDNGLIKFPWLRKGLDSILTNRHMYGPQLETFKQGKVEPSLSTFRKHGFTMEFTLATMVGIANSKGPGGMRKHLETARRRASESGDTSERSIAKNLLEEYVFSDPKSGPEDKKLLERGFSGSTPLSEDGLSHYGRRAYMLFKHFPFSEGRAFSELGEFALAADERLP